MEISEISNCNGRIEWKSRSQNGNDCNGKLQWMTLAGFRSYSTYKTPSCTSIMILYIDYIAYTNIYSMLTHEIVIDLCLKLVLLTHGVHVQQGLR